MTVLFVTPYYPPITGGVATFVRHLAGELQMAGHRALVMVPGIEHVISRRNPGEGPPVYSFYLRTPMLPGARLKSTLAFLVFFLPTLWSLDRFVRLQKVQIISLEYPLGYMIYFTWIRWLSGVAVVCGLHGSDVRSFRELSRLEQWAVRRLVRDADVRITHSQSLKADTHRIFGQRVGPIQVISYGIPVPPVGLPQPDGIGLPPDYILTVAKLHRRKGIDVLLRAIQKLGEDGVAPALVLAGDGPEQHALEELAARLGIADRVRFLGDVPLERVTALYTGCRFFVLASRSEPFGIVLLEAMALAKGIVATAVGGIPEFVEDGVTGLLVRPEDPDELARAIRRLLEDPGLAIRLGKRGREFFHQHFTMEAVLSQYLDLYASLCGYSASLIPGVGTRPVGQRIGPKLNDY